MNIRLASLLPVTALGLLAAACDSSDPEIMPDATEVWPDDLSPYTIDTRDASGAPTGAVVAYHDGNTWLAAAPTVPGIFTFTPTGRAVAYAVTCPAAADATFPSVRILIEYTTLGRERVLDHRCYTYYTDSTYLPFTMSVAPADAAVYLSGGHRIRGDEGLERTYEARAGRTDIVAMTAERVLIQRAVRLPPVAPLVLDVDASGSELARVPLTVPAARPDEQVSTHLSFTTAGGTYVNFPDVAADATELRVVPSALLRAGDRQSVSFDAALGPSHRSVSVPLENASSAELPAPYLNVTASWEPAAHVTWSGRPASTAPLSLDINQHTGDSMLSISANVSAAWLAETGQAVDGTWTIPDFGAVAGWQSARRLNPQSTNGASWYLSEYDSTADYTTSRSTSWSGSLEASSAP